MSVPAGAGLPAPAAPVVAPVVAPAGPGGPGGPTGSALEAYRVAAFGLAVRARRQALGLTPRRVADLAGLDVDEFLRLEAGLVSPTLTVMHRIADAFCTDVAEIAHESRARVTQLRVLLGAGGLRPYRRTATR